MRHATRERVRWTATAAVFFLLSFYALPRLFRPIAAAVLRPTHHPKAHVLDAGLISTNDLAAIAASLAAAALLLLLRDGRCAGRALLALSNLPRTPAHARQLALGLVLGTLAMGATVGAIAACGHAHAVPVRWSAAVTARTLVVFAVAFALVGLAEELGTRGFLQTALTRGLGFTAATILTSGWFAALHIVSGDPWWGAVSTGLRAAFECVVLRLTGSLGFAIGFHTAWDYTESALFGVPDSSWLMPASLFRTRLDGPVWLSGGAVGPEGSVFAYVVSLALLAGALARLRRPDRRRDRRDPSP